MRPNHFQKMLQHIDLTINAPEEIENFYEDVLFFTIKHKFPVNAEITRLIFNYAGTTEVFVMACQDTQLEIFLSPKKE